MLMITKLISILELFKRIVWKRKYKCLIPAFCCVIQIDPLDREAQIVNEMYELIDLFQVPTPPEDIAVYQVSDSTRVTTHLEIRE